MTDPQRALIAVLVDRSGSMQSIKSDTEGGFDAFIEAQRGGPLDIRVTLAQFDTHYDVVYTGRPIGEVPALELAPRGGTALYDALGRLVTDIGAELAALPEHDRPGKVTMLVLTDGHENSSTEWSHAAVRALIRQQEQQYAWEFVFLGANMDAVAIGANLGIRADRALTYAASGSGVSGAFASAAAYMQRRNAAPAGAPVPGFTQAEREAAQG